MHAGGLTSAYRMAWARVDVESWWDVGAGVALAVSILPEPSSPPEALRVMVNILSITENRPVGVDCGRFTEAMGESN